MRYGFLVGNLVHASVWKNSVFQFAYLTNARWGVGYALSLMSKVFSFVQGFFAKQRKELKQNDRLRPFLTPSLFEIIHLCKINKTLKLSKVDESLALDGRCCEACFKSAFQK